MESYYVSENSVDTPHTRNISSSEKGKLALVARYIPYAAIALVFFWFGGMKFTAYEAEAISLFISNSPFMSWLYAIFDERFVAGLIGSVEIVIGTLCLMRFRFPKLAMLGTGGAACTFLLTLSFFLSTPGIFLDGIAGPAISVVPGQFIIKDVGLLALVVMLLHESRQAVRFRDNIG